MIEIRRCTVAQIEAAPNLAAVLAEYAAESSQAELGPVRPQFATYRGLEATGFFHPIGFAVLLASHVAIVTFAPSPAPSHRRSNSPELIGHTWHRRSSDGTVYARFTMTTLDRRIAKRDDLPSSMTCQACCQLPQGGTEASRRDHAGQGFPPGRTTSTCPFFAMPSRTGHTVFAVNVRSLRNGKKEKSGR